jgi:hypothetical protein
MGKKDTSKKETPQGRIIVDYRGALCPIQQDGTLAQPAGPIVEAMRAAIKADREVVVNAVGKDIIAAKAHADGLFGGAVSVAEYVPGNDEFWSPRAVPVRASDSAPLLGIAQQQIQQSQETVRTVSMMLMQHITGWKPATEEPENGTAVIAYGYTEEGKEETKVLTMFNYDSNLGFPKKVKGWLPQHLNVKKEG